MMSFSESLRQDFDVLDSSPYERILRSYRVRERKPFGREFMLRLLPDVYCGDKGIVDAFHEFFTRLTQISNKTYIASVHSVVGAVNGSIYVLEEYVPGIPLREFAEKRKCSADFKQDVIHVIARVCEALHYAHQKNVFHLSISPDNILVDENNPSKVKLVGFGTQIFIEQNRAADLPTEARNCVAPEVLEGKSFGAGEDIYSLAVATREAFPEIQNCGDLLSRCLSKIPANRPSTARNFAQRLRGLIVQQDTGDKTRPKFNANSGGLQPLLTIRTEPTGAQLSVNGSVVGTTSDSGIRMPWKQGIAIEIAKSGYQTEALIFTDPPDNAEITVKLNSVFRLFTNPWGAKVLVDGAIVGFTDREGLVIPWDGRTIDIEKTGYKSETLKFVSPPKEQDSCFELRPMVSSVAPKRHIIKILGYTLGVIVLGLLYLLLYIGLKEAGLGKIVTGKDMANLNSNNPDLKRAVELWTQKIAALKETTEKQKEEIEKLRSDAAQQKLREQQEKNLRVKEEKEQLNKLEQQLATQNREITNLKEVQRLSELQKEQLAKEKLEKEQELAKLKEARRPPAGEKDARDRESPKLMERGQEETMDEQDERLRNEMFDRQIKLHAPWK